MVLSRPIPSGMQRTVWASTVALAALLPASARADVSSWLAVGGGMTTQLASGASSRDWAGAFTYSVGAGSSPLAPLVGGIVFRGTTMFTLGTDLGVAGRVCTGSFARGDWGVALDAGAMWRSWGQGAYGNWPLQGVLTLGAPWGLQLAVGATVWSIDGVSSSPGFYASLEVDLLRLTVMRRGDTERWWPNPNPAGAPEKTVGLLW
jgi:hypothetical protein